MFKQTYGGYTIGAFNVNNMELLSENQELLEQLGKKRLAELEAKDSK